jgi:hypothetical protein
MALDSISAVLQEGLSNMFSEHMVLLLFVPAVPLLLGLAFLAGASAKQCSECEWFKACPFAFGVSPYLPV